VHGASIGANPTELTCFKSNFESGPDSPMFEEQPPVRVVNGRFTLHVSPGDYFSVSTVKTAHKGSFADVPHSQPQFPLPLSDDFNTAAVSSQPKYWSNELGVFEVHPDTTNASNQVLRQMVRQPVLRKPGARTSVGDRGLACTVVGMLEWEDITISARFRLLATGASACVAARMDRFLEAGVMLCVNTTGGWTLSYGNPNEAYAIDRRGIKGIVARGTVHHPLTPGSWHRISLTTVKNASSGSLDGMALFSEQTIRTIDTGFAALATVSLLPMEFDDVRVAQAGTDWSPAAQRPPACRSAAAVGSQLFARRCQGNGIAAPDQEFEPLPDWQLQHTVSKLCVTVSELAPSASFTLQECERGELQLFDLDEPVVGRGQQLDFSDLRNGLVPLPLGPLGNASDMRLVGSARGDITLQRHADVNATAEWDLWVFFPGTRQLRNQKGGYKLKPQLGEPMCLSLCKL
jgi:hypothetical protein